MDNEWALFVSHFFRERSFKSRQNPGVSIGRQPRPQGAFPWLWKAPGKRVLGTRLASGERHSPSTKTLWKTPENISWKLKQRTPKKFCFVIHFSLTVSFFLLTIRRETNSWPQLPLSRFCCRLTQKISLPLALRAREKIGARLVSKCSVVRKF